MLKKLPLSLVAALFAFASYGQTIVSTSPENKKVILEEFTGIHCVYCPAGHAIAQAIQDNNPGDVFLINIHQGGFASPGTNEPDFRTSFGDAIVNQSYSGSGFGYPAATVNRHVFSGRSMASNGGPAMGRNYWTVSANEILAMSSYVNVAVEASLESATNIMTIHVEGYYTGDSPESTNLLNVAILQNNTKGPQTGGGAGNNYNHMHRLIDMVNGQWGEEITTTTAGTFFERDYTYQIIPHNNYVPVEIGELEVVAFVSETQQEIISGHGTIPTVSVTHSNDAYVRYIEEFKVNCVGEEQVISPKVNIQNAGSNQISSMEIDYTLNGTSGTYSWTGTLESLESKTITLPEITFTIEESNSIEVSIADDDYNSSNTLNIPFEGAPEGTGTIKIEIRTDPWGSEFRWELRDSDGNLAESGNGYPSRSTINLRFDVEADCYTFNIFDSYGDGGTRVTVKDHEGTELYFNDGTYGSKDTGYFSSNGVLGVNQPEIGNINIYPNPTRDILNITNAENANIQVFDILGKMIISKEGISLNEQLNVSSLNAGAYFLKISKEGNVTTKKFIVAK